MSNGKKKGASGADTSTVNINPTSNPADSDRLNKIGKLVFKCIGAIEGAPYEEYRDLAFWDHETIMKTLRGRLDQYSGPLKKRPFLKWATKFIRREAQKYQMLDAARGEYKNLIRAAISRKLSGPVKDCAVGVDDVYNDFLHVVFKMGPVLAKPDSAPLSSRLYGLAQTHTYLYFTGKRNKHFAKVLKRIAEKGTWPLPECLSDVEFAQMRAGEENT